MEVSYLATATTIAIAIVVLPVELLLLLLLLPTKLGKQPTNTTERIQAPQKRQAPEFLGKPIFTYFFEFFWYF